MGSMTMAVGSQATLAMIPILQNLTGVHTMGLRQAHGTAMGYRPVSIALTAALADGVVAVGAPLASPA